MANKLNPNLVRFCLTAAGLGAGVAFRSGPQPQDPISCSPNRAPIPAVRLPQARSRRS